MYLRQINMAQESSTHMASSARKLVDAYYSSRCFVLTAHAA
jgi:hypothetical protein